MRLVVGISGSTGSCIAFAACRCSGISRRREHLNHHDAGTHDRRETDYRSRSGGACHPRLRHRDIGAAVASGSFRTDGR